MTDDDEDWDSEDWSDDDEDVDDDEQIACPECGAAMSEYTDKCPKCGYWLTDADKRSLRTGENRPVWQRAVAIFFVIAFVLLLLWAGSRLF